ncbi:MAG: hypothetical protein WDA02_11045, partial [Saccharofermentanales bacterium]
DLPSLIVAFEASSYALKADVLAGNIKKRLSLITLQCFETAPFIFPFSYNECGICRTFLCSQLHM